MQAFALSVFVAYVISGLIQDSEREYSVHGTMHSLAPEWAGQGREETVLVNAEVGHRIGERHQLGMRVGYDWVEDREGRGSTSAVYGLLLNPRSRNVLFCNISSGLAFNGLPSPGLKFDDVDDAKVQLGVGAGLKALTSKSAAVRVEYRYDRVLDTPRWRSSGGCRVIRTSQDLDRHGIYVGLSVFVGGQSAAAR